MRSDIVSCGIDHGTTNSSIAVMDGDKPRVIKPNGVDPIMPSAVYIDKRGRLLVGRPAFDAIFLNDEAEGNGYTRYKLRIGQDDRYDFTAARKVMSAQELGAAVIGELLRAYRDDMKHEPKACVITVPANFEDNACNGTREAARLAGLSYFPLLQEPIAAALAYGFTADERHAQWMVFDLGGGTLDVSLVIVRNGQMVVPEEGHAGDTRLGGSKFDRELLDHVRGELSKTYALSGLTEKSPTWSRLLLAVERAKIELSRREQSVVELEGEPFKDDTGKSVTVEVPITRAQYERLIAPDVEKAVHICQMLLGRNRLASRDITRLILIGGPTKTPYIQRMLAERLGIHLDTTIDPMTAVAEGAALYATTVEIPDAMRDTLAVPVPLEKGGASIELSYERKSRIPTIAIAGRVNGEALAAGGVTVETRRSDGGFSSGRLPVDEAGIFSMDVMLVDSGKPHLSRFTTVAFDRSGRQLCAIDEPEIWYPFPEGRTRLANSLRIAVKSNRTAVLIKHGAGLPVRNRPESFLSTKAIRKGSSEDILRIPVMESVAHLLGGEDDHADCNVRVGTLTICGDDARVSRDLPVGTEILVTLQQDESRVIGVVAYVPLIDEEFAATYSKAEYDVAADQIAERFEQTKSALAEIEKLQADKPIAGVKEALETLRKLSVVDSITKEIQRAKDGDRDAMYGSYRHVLELAGAVNYIHTLQQLPRIERRIDRLEPVCKDEARPTLQSMKQELNAARGSGDPAALEAVERSLVDLDGRIRAQPFHEVLIDVFAIGGQLVTQHQNNLFEKARLLYERLENKGGVNALTDRDIADLASSHQELVGAFPNLFELRDQALRGLPPGGLAGIDISDVKKTR